MNLAWESKEQAYKVMLHLLARSINGDPLSRRENRIFKKANIASLGGKVHVKRTSKKYEDDPRSKSIRDVVGGVGALIRRDRQTSKEKTHGR